MDNWQKGDLALCVHLRTSEVPVTWKCVIGGIYTVKEVSVFFDGVTALDLEEDPDFLPDAAWDARDFRKIHPHTPDAEDRETIELLTGKPLLAPVGAGEG